MHVKAIALDIVACAIASVPFFGWTERVGGNRELQGQSASWTVLRQQDVSFAQGSGSYWSGELRELFLTVC
jgi:hypothetical protein